MSGPISPKDTAARHTWAARDIASAATTAVPALSWDAKSWSVHTVPEPNTEPVVWSVPHHAASGATAGDSLPSSADAFGAEFHHGPLAKLAATSASKK